MVRRTMEMNCLKVETMRREIIRTKRGYIKLYKYIFILFNHRVGIIMSKLKIN